MRAIARFLFGRSATAVVPVVAITAILWGVAFLTEPEIRRPAFGPEATALDIMPFWGWAWLMLIAGGLMLIVVRPWAVAILAFVLAAYAGTLFVNIFRFDDAPFTAPIWPASQVAILIFAASRVGVRRVSSDGAS
jgi:hypothetical protein